MLITRQKWRIKLVVGMLFIGLAVYVITIHRFLAITSRVHAEVLVVEGWIWQKPAMEEVVEEFQKGGYGCLVTVGAPVSGHRISNTQSYADLAAERLVDLGIEERSIHSLTVPETDGHRTYHSALMVRDWVNKQRPTTKGVNVFSLGVHARKSQMIFRKAFGPRVEVGIIAGTESVYPGQMWWSSRAGVYLVLRNTLGYLYALSLSFRADLPQ